jgi:DNA-binding transcriptional LysR family regulator
VAKADFNDLLWFLVVANERSFTKAAAKLGVAQSTLSHTIKRLEERMGLRLLTRTTRNVAPTEAGERLRHSLEPRIAAIEADIAALMAFRDKPSGTVRITLPEHARELIAHSCINMRQTTAGGLYAWEFDKGGQDFRVRVDGQLTFNTSYAMIDAAVAGYGIAYVPENLVEQHVAEGHLRTVLEAWSPKFAGYYLYYPSRRQNSPAFNVIVDALRHRKA